MKAGSFYSTGLALVVMFATVPAFAWHDEGHRIVARIAEHHLNDKARIELRRILANSDVAGGLATAATYLDDHRPMLSNQQPGSSSWHYDDLEVCDAPQPSFCQGGACASAAINRHLAMLADGGNHDGIKLQALRYVVHIVGDIQQPLHASNNHDQGGNEVKLNPVFESFGYYDNLHSLWDGYWVKKAMRTSRLKEADFADALNGRYQSHAGDWAAGSVSDWIKESHKLGETVVYGKLAGWTCGKLISDKLTLAADYLAVGDELVPQQLYKGGVRLANLLNASLGR
ncbi:S1/P1 nuclease [Chitinimonas sp.]|uniref:S1/P1 nuclease n=1 Tax=Chitinimonas sp. TaxID=1934313 RepID=UPI0035B18961